MILGEGGEEESKIPFIFILQYIPCSEKSEEKQIFFFFQPIK
jgi:hypothetical protein